MLTSCQCESYLIKSTESFCDTEQLQVVQFDVLTIQPIESHRLGVCKVYQDLHKEGIVLKEDSFGFIL